jgi:dihydrofolate reductase
MLLSIIVAISENNVIGRDGKLPWHLSGDLRRFKRLTTGRAIIMGRRTWESIGRPLPGRASIVISRQPGWDADGAIVAPDLDAAIASACQYSLENEVFIVGGAAIYGLALLRAERLYLTRVHAIVEGNVEFPTVDWSQWQLIAESRHPADERNEFAHTFQEWHRIRA